MGKISIRRKCERAVYNIYLRTGPKIQNIYTQKWNCAFSFPISAFMYLWVIYTFPRSVCLCCCIAFADQSWEYINRSQIHEWKLGTRQRSFIYGNFCFNFLVQCICNAMFYCMAPVRQKIIITVWWKIFKTILDKNAPDTFRIKSFVF
jgi:hypothetical protein